MQITFRESVHFPFSQPHVFIKAASLVTAVTRVPLSFTESISASDIQGLGNSRTLLLAVLMKQLREGSSASGQMLAGACHAFILTSYPGALTSPRLRTKKASRTTVPRLPQQFPAAQLI